MEESRRGILREKLEAWQRAAGAGVSSCDGLSSESAFGELQLARPLRAYGFLPTLQRRLAVLRELGAAVAEEHRYSLYSDWYEPITLDLVRTPAVVECPTNMITSSYYR